ncbi:hypothetical protein LZK98_11015 [Sphingomonas cannabina]|uniref:hypothetical protein n=1 Tax=Sphingomonas cannabina TaxID=2899123 RepID=UPI001F2635DE|nr:hypothetical protein [Sphingomonas cannabina]UIJ43621.1 hypothetical protein LZK98_11015 [Sphingomonas cannabina]
MSTRISSLAVLLLLAACGQASDTGNAEQAAGDRIDCAPPGAQGFSRVCTIDRMRSDDGLILTVHQPGGGFHRLRTTRDGRGVVAADGAEQAAVSVVDPRTIEIAIGGARYRLPATVGPIPKR